MATLTYAKDPWTLVPKDLQLFMKRLRKIMGRPVRFYGVGEYGDQSFRPHFHVALFGVSLLEQKLVEQAWSVKGESLGFVHLAELNEKSAAYVAGYVCKKLTKKWNPELQGRHPEFCRMSLRPAIGAKAIDSISLELQKAGPSLGVARAGDVPSEVRIAGRTYPLGRYLRRLLRQSLGWNGETPAPVKRMFSLRCSLQTRDDLILLGKKRSASKLKAQAKVVLRRNIGKFKV